VSEGRANRSDALHENYIRRWNLVGPPLRPYWEDLQIMQGEIARWCRANGGSAARALILGVTPELAALDWPTHSRVYSVDRSIEMIRSIWYTSAPHAKGAAAGDWAKLPVRDRSFDLMLGDGSFAFWAWPDGYRCLLDEAVRTLKPSGRLIVRFQVRPEVLETPVHVFDELAAGRIGGFNTFKWRLVVAVHGDSTDGVRLGDVWNAWRKSGVEPERLAVERRWPLAVIQTIDAYRDAEIRYFIPRAGELHALLGERLREVACHTPTYEEGSRYRIISLERPA
jgi:SAM-dependent methyltransferase